MYHNHPQRAASVFCSIFQWSLCHSLTLQNYDVFFEGANIFMIIFLKDYIFPLLLRSTFFQKIHFDFSDCFALLYIMRNIWGAAPIRAFVKLGKNQMPRYNFLYYAKDELFRDLLVTKCKLKHPQHQGGRRHISKPKKPDGRRQS